MFRIKAITIIEIVVTLALGTIVIMIAMMAYMVVSNQFARYKQLNDELQKVYEVNFLLQKDIQESKSFELNQTDSTLIIAGFNKIIYLRYSDNLIIRQYANNIDTFNLKLKIEDLKDKPVNNLVNSNDFRFTYFIESTLEYSGYQQIGYDSKVLVEQNVDE
ncbi:MAG: hypothetical protein K8R68_08905 [Bacteroidales bacterium]|nr:hypothetical protein [Bacteroidales bacterium]